MCRERERERERGRERGRERERERESWLTVGSLVIGDTPVALCCFLSTNLSPIFGEMAGQGREPLVLSMGMFDVQCHIIVNA